MRLQFDELSVRGRSDRPPLADKGVMAAADAANHQGLDNRFGDLTGRSPIDDEVGPRAAAYIAAGDEDLDSRERLQRNRFLLVTFDRLAGRVEIIDALEDEALGFRCIMHAQRDGEIGAELARRHRHARIDRHIERA